MSAAFSTSMGDHIPPPELLTRMSSVPPVMAFTLSTARAIDSSSVTSSCRISMPISLRCWTFAKFLAVAKTRSPCLWNSWARASPMPPSLEPVINTDFRAIVIDMDVEFESSGLSELNVNTEYCPGKEQLNLAEYFLLKLVNEAESVWR